LVVYSSKYLDFGQGRVFLATASEDTSVIIAPAMEMKKVFEPITVEGHISGVKDMSLSLKNPNEGLLFTVGGYGALKCWRLTLTKRCEDRVELQSVCLANCPTMKYPTSLELSLSDWCCGS